MKQQNQNNGSKASLRRQDIISKPIGQQLVVLTIPMLYALISIMGLGLVDSYFISYLGTEQLAAIGFIVPITSCSGLMILDTNLGGKIHLTEVFNDNKKKDIQSRV